MIASSTSADATARSCYQYRRPRIDRIRMPPTDALRILDASLNRAGEGLRVVEDYVRFVLDDPFLTRADQSACGTISRPRPQRFRRRSPRGARHAARRRHAISTHGRARPFGRLGRVCGQPQTHRAVAPQPRRIRQAGRRRIRRPDGIAPLPAVHAGKGDRRRPRRAESGWKACGCACWSMAANRRTRLNSWSRHWSKPASA